MSTTPNCFSQCILQAVAGCGVTDNHWSILLDDHAFVSLPHSAHAHAHTHTLTGGHRRAFAAAIAILVALRTVYSTVQINVHKTHNCKPKVLV